MRRSELTLFVDRDRRENPSQDVVEIEVLSIVNPWRRILDDIGSLSLSYILLWREHVDIAVSSHMLQTCRRNVNLLQ